MDVPVLMPQLGNEIEEAQIDAWLKAVGDKVSEGEQIDDHHAEADDGDRGPGERGTQTDCRRGRRAGAGRRDAGDHRARLMGDGDLVSRASEVGGQAIAYAELGGNGPKALMLHGFGSDRLSWLANQPTLEGVASLAALDLPGHGEFTMDVGDGDVATLAQRVAAVMDEQGLRGVHLIGHSLGGAIAIVLAASRPDLAASLALIAPAGLGRQIDPTFLSAFPEISRPDEAEALLKRLVVRPRLIGKPLISRVLAQLEKPGAREALRAVGQSIQRGSAALDAAIARVGNSGLPRLVVWGEQDGINPPSQPKLDAFGATVAFVPESGHLPQVESPRLVNARLVSFLMAA